MRAECEVNCNAVVCVADGMCAEIKVWAGGGVEAHRFRWPSAISPMSWDEEKSQAAARLQRSCCWSERTGARVVMTRKRAFILA